MNTLLNESVALPASELRGILDAASVAILMSNREGMVCLANEEAFRMLGFSPRELHGMHVSALLPPIYHESLRAFLDRFWSEPEKSPTGSGPEFCVRRKDGAELWVQMGFNPVLVKGVRYALGSMIDITARKQTERALRESEEKFSKAFRACPDAISISDLSSGCFIDVNEGYERISGYKREELIGRSSSEMGIWVNLADRDRMSDILQRRGSIRDMQLQARTRSGAIESFLVSAEPIEIGRRPCVVVASQNITARLQAEQAMRESEEKFAMAFRSSPDAMSIAELDTSRYVEVNEVHERFFGYKREEVIGRTPWELGIIPDPKFSQHVRELVREAGPVRDLELVVTLRSGERRTILYSGERIRLGGRECLLRCSRDITDRQRAERALRESEEKFAKAFRNSPYLLMITELATGRFLDVNSGFERLCGYTREEVLGRTTLELGLWVDPAARSRLVQQLAEGVEIRKRPARLRTKQGREIDALCTCDPIEVAGVKCILATFEDMTEQLRAQRERERLEEQLRQSQKLEALGTLAGGIAHDFNNILTGIVVYRELALMDAERPAELRNHLEEITLACNRARDLVRQILTFSRQQKQERTFLALPPVVAEAMKLVRSVLPATIDIQFETEGAVPQVLADAGQIHQIIMNLATNAAHAIGGRPGHLTVKVSARVADEELCRLDHHLRPGRYAQLSIADSGCGMDPLTLAHMFEPFFTTKAPGEGTGLGLAVVHGIMEDHDGAVLVDSKPGEGTRFDLFFPEQHSASAAPIEPAAAAPSGQDESILLIDDEPVLCQSLGALLRKLGYRVTALMDPSAALEQFRNSPDAFDLVLTDQTMPRLTGLDVLREVHRLRPGRPVILMSGFASSLSAEKLRSTGAAALIPKPVDFGGLTTSLRQALKSSGAPT